ncbi:MAG TPA: SCO family protein [Albitalea sp.]
MMTTTRRPPARAALLATLAIGLLAPACASAGSAPVWDWPAPPFADVDVTDQAGRRLRFQRDVLAGRTVAVNFVFTSCTTICSPLAASFAAVQKELRARMGHDVHLVSVSVDPLNDTPSVLREYGARFGAGPGWTFLTGGRASIDRILRDFGVPPGGDLSRHTPLVYIGHGDARAWTRMHGLAEPRTIAAALLQAAARGASGHGPVQP